MTYPFLLNLTLPVTILSCEANQFGNTVVVASIGGVQLPDITILGIAVGNAVGQAGFADIQGRVQSIIMNCITDGINAVK